MRQDNSAAIWIIDQDAQSAGLLQRICCGLADVRVQVIDQSISFRQQMTNQKPALCLVNYYLGESFLLDQINLIRMKSPDTKIIMLTSPGSNRRELEEWRDEEDIVDAVVEKPLVIEDLQKLLRKHLDAWRASSRMHAELHQLSSTQASHRWTSVLADMQPGEAILTEMTVLITDVRHSTERMLKEQPREFLAELNAWLSRQTERVQQYEGSVIKFTGDGLFAIFEGGARQYLAGKCALAILQDKSLTSLPTGIGMADGLVLGGLIGSATRYQFDITGGTAHMAARLCARAQEWELIAPAACISPGAPGEGFAVRPEQISLRGFTEPVDTWRIQEV